MFILIGQPGVKVHTNNIAMLQRNSKLKATHDICIVGRTKVNLSHMLHVLYASCDFPTVDVYI